MTGHRRLERLALVGLLLLAFVPRAIYPVSRPLQWYFRSAQFFDAILHGDLAGTLFSEHPGVTVMWLSGAALWGWYGVQSLLGLNPPTPLETEGYAFFDRVAVGVVPLALAVSLGIVWGWFLLRKLFGRRVAWVAAVLWAIDPFFLANSKSLHLDALLSTLMILSALWMLLYLRERRWRHVILSAILGGLAILTKVSAIFLVPFLGLVLLAGLVRALFAPDRAPRTTQHETRITYYVLRITYCVLRVTYSALRYLLPPLIAWLLIATLVITALWPSLWVQPGKSFDVVIRQGILLHKDDTRNLPLFYRGTLAVHDPGVRFYLDTVLYRTTFVTLPFFVLGLCALWFKKPDERLALLLLFSFGMFLFVQMSLSSWKDGRYLLPSLLAVDVLAACGLIWWVERIAKKRAVQIGIVGGLVLLQAVLVWVHHPYYGTHYNVLLGGAQAALRIFPLAEWAEGVDRAGQYVDGQPGAEDFVVGTQFLANEMLSQHVRAPVYEPNEVEDEADYLVFGVQYTMRGKNLARWGKLWEETYKFREPEYVASFGGLPYAWVHRPGAEPVIPERTDARLGEAIRLAGYRLAQDELAPGDTLLLTLYWRTGEPFGGDYTVFVHLQGPDGDLVAQQDNPPVRGTWPTGSWEAGTLVEDPYEIKVPAEAAFGEYVLSVGMYDPATVERLEAVGADGEQLPEDRVVLTDVPVQPSVPLWRWALSGLWVAAIVIGVVVPVLTQRRKRE